MKTEKNKSEELFAELCATKYLNGFVYHSPKFYNPTEQEAGDIVLWVRFHLIVVEVLWRNSDSSENTQKFIRRIGEKRKQLINDFKNYHDEEIDISMTNIDSQSIVFPKQYLLEDSFLGVILIDTDVELGKLHIESFKKSLNQEFPIAIMTKKSFERILNEVDTIPDLAYYLEDRFNFIRKIFKLNEESFLTINNTFERNLISFYKMNENNFTESKWDFSNDYTIIYLKEFKTKIHNRDEDNKMSIAIDKLIDDLRKMTSPILPLLEHSTELASLPRRARAGEISFKYIDALYQVFKEGRKERHYAIHNTVTGNWLLFYFCNSNNDKAFSEKANSLLKLKILHEINLNDFEYSVFLYGMGRKLDNSFIYAYNVLDAIDFPLSDIDEKDIIEAKKYFTTGQRYEIEEFPMD